MEPLIYQYLDYREFLNDLYNSLHKKDPSFSLRAFSRLCGSTSPNLLKLILARKIALNPKAIEKLAEAAGMEKPAIHFFELLISFDESKTFSEREKIYQEILQLKTIQTQSKVEKRQFDYYNKWYHSAIRALLGYYKFNPDTDNYNTLGTRLSPAITGRQASSSIGLLIKLGLIRKDASGFLVQTDKSISSGQNTRSLEIYKYQNNSLDLAKEALDKVSLKQRDITTLTLNISEKGYEQIKEKISKLRAEIIAIAANDAEDDRVYQANFLLFPLTKLKSKNEKV